MGSFSASTSGLVISSSSQAFLEPPNIHLRTHLYYKPIDTPVLKPTNLHLLKSPVLKIRATLDEKDRSTPVPVIVQEEEEEEVEQPNKEVEESVKVLKNAAKTRRVAVEEILSALSVIEKAKLDPSGFHETLGGSKSPGRTWRLVFTTEKRLERGGYFPIPAFQRFDAAAKRIENGVYFEPLVTVTFEGRFSWKKRMLAFIFEKLRIKIGPFNLPEIDIKGKDESEPSNKNPFFIWFYIDEEIAVARGKSGGTAFWCRC